MKEADATAPEVWKDACIGNIRRRQLWSSKIRSREEQLPPVGSTDEKILGEIYRMAPAEFEKFVVALIDKLPEIISGLDHRIEQTQQTGDHGVDFFGSFTLPYPVSYEIEFVGEAKRYSDRVTPEKVSRLVARLGRGQYGLFFTTSWFSERAEKEVIADRYPVRMFAGIDIVNILKAGNLISRDRLDPAWKKSILDSPRTVGVSGLVPRVS